MSEIQEPELPPEGHPLRTLGKHLAALLDDDHWNNAEPMLLEAYRQESAALAALSREVEGQARLLRDALDLVPRISDDDPMAPALADWCRSARAALEGKP